MKKIAFKLLCSLTLLILALSGGLPVPAEGAVLCVTEDGAGDRDGNGWDNACGEADFIHALRHAVSGDEFWVSAGKYRPDLSGNVEPSFEMKDGVGLYGGFSGRETSRDQRDWVTNETTLTGNLLVGNKNSKTVVIASNIGNTAVLDGFTITGGRGGTSTKNYDNVEIYVGGGMYNIKGSPTVRNCTFSDNKAGYGGAVYNEENYSGDWLYFTNCTFSNNSSNYPRGISDKLVRGGGAVYNDRSASIFTNCTFSDNSDTSSEPATWYVGGGVVYNHESISAFRNCTFSGNSAINWENSALGRGGGAYNEGYGSGRNPGNNNETLYRFPTFENCIFWDNTDRQIVNENSVGVSVTYCVVQDGSSGITGGGTISEIISDDPNLQPLGEYGGATKTIAIGPGSSARDQGISTVFSHVRAYATKDQRGFPRDASYDIGSYECRDDLNILTVAVTGLGTVSRASSGDALTSSNQWIYSRDLPVTLTAVPISPNHFKGWGGVLSGTALSTQLTMTEDRYVTANFGDSWTILATAGESGTITPSGHVRVRQGTDQTFAISANSGYSLSEVTVDGTSVGTPSSYTFSNVTEDHSISAVFSGNEEEEEWIVAAQAGEGGTISPSGAVRVPNGGSVTFAISAESPFTTKDVVVDGTSQGTLSSYTFSNVRANHDIKALFFTDAWTIDASAGEDGTISPSGSVTVPHGENVTFTITPEEGQTIEGVTVDGAFAGRGEIYLFTDVRSNHTIEASFSDDATDGGASAGCQVGGAPLSYFWLLLPLVLLRRGKR